MIPVAGESVLILHTSNGNGKVTRRKRNVSLCDNITHVYIGGAVSINGDVFTVKPCQGKEAKWETTS